MASNTVPGRPQRGRPRKHLTPAAAIQAKKESDRQRYLRQRQPQGPADFIAYEPQLHADVPTDTPPEIGLRTSVDISIPQENGTQGCNNPQAPRSNRVPPAEPHTTNEDAKIARQIGQIRANEQESNIERDEYEAAIGQRLDEMDARTAEILLQIRFSRGQENTSMGDDVEGSTNGKEVLGTLQGRTPPQTPNQRSSLSQPPSNRTGSRPSTSFPAQRNNLLSWIQPLPGEPPSNQVSSQPVMQKSPSITSSSPLHPATYPERSVPARSIPNTASPAPATAASTTTSPEPLERTAFKLAKQLRRFQGCTHEQHNEVERLHQEHHQRPDVHSACSSIRQITTLLRGEYNGGTPLPDVLSSPKLMKPADVRSLDCQSAFEGTSTSAFPEDYDEHSTYLSHQDQQLWYDAVLSPALKKTIGCSNILQHYPASTYIAKLDSTAVAAESLAQKESAREQLLGYALQPQHLDSLWDCILESVAENPGFSRFKGATLFMNAKNTKLKHMDTSLTSVCGRWEECWSNVTDPQFYNKNRTFIDLAKQVTSKDSALPYDQIPDDREAEVFLWRKCCLEAYAQTREVLNTDGSRAKGNPKRTIYSWATMRDTTNQTLFAPPHGKESTDALIYSQFYGLVKTPFDTSKVYIFDNESLENLALDPGYIRSLQQEGGGITFSKAVCEFAYLHSKKRAHANLIDNQWKSYGIREEHRISLTMMEEIREQWRQWDLYDDSIDDINSTLPYYIVPTQELLSFLYGQINKYCFLFEHILAHTAMTYSLPETMVMVIALRALRFCYGGSLIQRESLLYKNRWEQTHGQKIMVKEGLGMRETIERCGFGWFLPKFNWTTWRLAPPHGDNILVGNLLMHKEYKRRWRAVKDLRDVYVRFNQAESWYDRYNVHHNLGLLGKWLEYLHVLNLEQFDTDVWKAMLKANKRYPELTPETIQRNGEIDFCYRGMKEKAERWLDEFLHLVRLTHWILPYPSNTALIASTKTSHRQGLKGRMMWFSAVYAHPDKVELPFQSMPCTLYDILWNARRQTFGEGGSRDTWGTSQLISACRAQGVRIYGLEQAEEHWVVGKRSVGAKGFKPVWERARPPKLRMLAQIRNKSLDELDGLMMEFTRDQGEESENASNEEAGVGVGTNRVNRNEEDEVSDSRRAPLRRSIREVFARSFGANRDGNDEGDSIMSVSVTVSSGSIFVPSASDG
ncbi:hypothetical protein K469DRAFT_610840 [Zopfia rhizophila CBS 207.26]|uniref:Uncharacterized protein n=1 Tax=Zopfia rhizophila CBS 207.26 TaxID=1314779 RepID=A0A6A6D7M1_9PEZI|nr:hypothetical protein K469DRAFT_610840 [Zopfia rhizophila CBS 207.26]